MSLEFSRRYFHAFVRLSLWLQILTETCNAFLARNMNLIINILTNKLYIIFTIDVFLLMYYIFRSQW